MSRGSWRVTSPGRARAAPLAPPEPSTPGAASPRAARPPARRRPPAAAYGRSPRRAAPRPTSSNRHARARAAHRTRRGHGRPRARGATGRRPRSSARTASTRTAATARRPPVARPTPGDWSRAATSRRPARPVAARVADLGPRTGQAPAEGLGELPHRGGERLEPPAQLFGRRRGPFEHPRRPGNRTTVRRTGDRSKRAPRFSNRRRRDRPEHAIEGG